MSALAFPAAGILALFAVAIPLATLVSVGLLRLLGHRLSPRVRFGLLVAPSLAPLVWASSAAVHQAEPREALAACLHDHPELAACLDALILVGALGFVGAWVLGATWRRARLRVGPGVRDERAVARLEAIVAARPALCRARVVLVSEAAHPLATVGVLRPRVVVDVALVHRLDDAGLEGALLHELEHVEGRDPLALFVLAVSFGLNPARHLLERELGVWRVDRELGCDRAAVARGADPLALAQAIVTAAGHPAGSFAACLAGDGLDAIRRRVARLLEYAERRPLLEAPARGSRSLALLCLLLALGAPHAWGGPVDAFHRHVEAAAAR